MQRMCREFWFLRSPHWKNELLKCQEKALLLLKQSVKDGKKKKKYVQLCEAQYVVQFNQKAAG